MLLTGIVLVRGEDGYQLRGIVDRQGIQEYGVDQGEDGRVGPDPQGQREYRD